MFYFRLHPLQWQFEGDGEQVFRALELADGNYLVTFITENSVNEVTFTQQEVTQSVALGHWVITDENGE